MNSEPKTDGWEELARQGYIGEVLHYDASRSVIVEMKRVWYAPWRRRKRQRVMSWSPTQRSAAAMAWIVENYLADKWDIDLYAREEEQTRDE